MLFVGLFFFMQKQPTTDICINPTSNNTLYYEENTTSGRLQVWIEPISNKALISRKSIALSPGVPYPGNTVTTTFGFTIPACGTATSCPGYTGKIQFYIQTASSNLYSSYIQQQCTCSAFSTCNNLLCSTSYQVTALFTAPSAGSYTIRYYIWDNDGKQLLTEAKDFTVQTTPTCPAEGWTPWTLNQYITHGQYQERTYYTYGPAPACQTTVFDTGFRTVCDSGYVVSGTTSSTANGFQSCVAQCTPNCAGKVCGDDGCGGSCGTCPTGQTCSSNQCVGSCNIKSFIDINSNCKVEQTEWDTFRNDWNTFKGQTLVQFSTAGNMWYIYGTGVYQ